MDPHCLEGWILLENHPATRRSNAMLPDNRAVPVSPADFAGAAKGPLPAHPAVHTYIFLFIGFIKNHHQPFPFKKGEPLFLTLNG
jgi:hypothetical protein